MEHGSESVTNKELIKSFCKNVIFKVVLQKDSRPQDELL